MTPAQLEQQSRDAVIAYLQDSSVKLEYTIKSRLCWLDKHINHDDFYIGCYYYRIAQTKPWYRVALFKDGICIADRDEEESQYIKSDYFIKWLTDRIPYEN